MTSGSRSSSIYNVLLELFVATLFGWLAHTGILDISAET